MAEESTKIIEKFNKLKIDDFEKLQIHVIFDYMPIRSNDSSSFTPEFMDKIVKQETNSFNFSFTNKPEHILEKNINKTELETLLPELNKLIEAEKEKAEKETADYKNQFLASSGSGGTRITKRQKKTPLKRNKHHTAKKHT
jgi:hypothetical protein